LSRERILLSGVPVNPVTVDETHDFIAQRVHDRAPAQVVTVNAEFVVRAQSDAAFAAVLRGADLATPDGAGVLWALGRRGIHLTERVGGSDLIWSVSRLAADRGFRIFLLGGAEGVADAAARKLETAYPGLLVAGAFAGSPARRDEEAIVDLICRSRADILFVAFGAPEQDLWIARNLGATRVGCAIGVGGSFDYLAGTARRAPLWMQRNGLEWMWRLIRQPWRWRRMLALPRFVWLVLRTTPRSARTERRTT